MFTQMVEAFVELRDREARGVGKQNFPYGTALDQFARVACTISPQLYRTLVKVLPMRSEKNLQ